MLWGVKGNLCNTIYQYKNRSYVIEYIQFLILLVTGLLVVLLICMEFAIAFVRTAIAGTAVLLTGMDRVRSNVVIAPRASDLDWAGDARTQMAQTAAWKEPRPHHK